MIRIATILCLFVIIVQTSGFILTRPFGLGNPNHLLDKLERKNEERRKQMEATEQKVVEVTTTTPKPIWRLEGDRNQNQLRKPSGIKTLTKPSSIYERWRATWNPNENKTKKTTTTEPPQNGFENLFKSFLKNK